MCFSIRISICSASYRPVTLATFFVNLSGFHCEIFLSKIVFSGLSFYISGFIHSVLFVAFCKPADGSSKS